MVMWCGGGGEWRWLGGLVEVMEHGDVVWW